MIPDMIRYHEDIGNRVPKPGHAGRLSCVFILLGAGLVFSLPAQAAEIILPNLRCVSAAGQSATLAAFAAGRQPMALALPIQRHGRTVKTFDVHLHAVWLSDPLQQAEAMASDVQQGCFVISDIDGVIKDVVHSPATLQHTKIFESSN